MKHTEPVNVSLDGRLLDAPCATLGDALRAGVEAARSQGRIVVEVKADGQRIADEALADTANALPGIGTIELLSAHPRELVEQSLRDAVGAMELAANEQDTAADLIQEGKAAQAMDHLRPAFTAWQGVRDVVDRSAALLGVDLATLRLPGIDDDQGFGPAAVELRTHLRALRDAMEQEDWSAMTDTLMYDMAAQTQRWRTLLTAFAAHVRAGTGEK